MKAILSAFLSLAVALTIAAQIAKPPLRVGDKAPDFALPNGDGKLVTLSEYTARAPVVIVFYRGFW
jgi:peroxiredoxin